MFGRHSGQRACCPVWEPSCGTLSPCFSKNAEAAEFRWFHLHVLQPHQRLLCYHTAMQTGYCCTTPLACSSSCKVCPTGSKVQLPLNFCPAAGAFIEDDRSEGEVEPDREEAHHAADDVGTAVEDAASSGDRGLEWGVAGRAAWGTLLAVLVDSRTCLAIQSLVGR